MSEDVAVVGSGPNGLAAAVTMARAGLSVRVYELAGRIGGGTRTAEVTLPGFAHDICSAVHPMVLASAFFRAFELDKRIEFAIPEISYGHPLDGGRAGIAYRDLDRAAAGLGIDGAAYRRLYAPLVRRIEGVSDFTGNQLWRLPRDPVAALSYGLKVLEQGSPFWNVRFRGDMAPAMISGVNAHSIGRMPRPGTAGSGLLLGAHAHAAGWPVPIGGSQAIADALAADLRAHGGRISLGSRITDLGQIPAAAVLLDVAPAAFMQMAGDRLPSGYRRQLEGFRYGNAVAKADFALAGPVPWANPELARAPTVHLGGTRAALAAAEAAVAAGRHPENPYVLLNQPSVLDPSRAPDGHQVLWAYTHVPAGSTADMCEAITAQIERFAPGFRDQILAVNAISAAEYGRYNPNYVGGDISAGAVTMWQLLKRPVLSPNPWRTPVAGVYLCSSSTPPGPSVHGLCGLHAARHALAEVFGLPAPYLGL